MPIFFEDTRKAIAGMDSTFDSIETTLGLADSNLRNLEGFTKPLGERGEQIFDNIDRVAGRMDLLMLRLTEFSDTLNRREGSLGRLMNDPELYDNINSAAANINELACELRPIVRDVRVFSDKIARDPGRLGVRGVFQQNAPIK